MELCEMGAWTSTLTLAVAVTLVVKWLARMTGGDDDDDDDELSELQSLDEFCND